MGIVEVCDGGTVFLDEIAEMSVELQARLLRFLETGETRRVGSSRNVAFDTRVVAATNRDQESLERGEGFRTDLYYRLAHAVVVLPPLRHRGEDVSLLSEYFLAESCAEAGKQVRLSAAAQERLRSHSWPGNVRQLRAVIKRSVILSGTEHEVSESALRLGEGKAPTTLLDELALAERRRIAEALSQARGSRTEASKALGIPRTTFISKLRRYGLA
jgi:DNA-binding NtrC family response regulator